MGKVAVIILNYKVLDETLECLKSVEASDYKNLQIIVVDNDSGDGLEKEILKLARLDESAKRVQDDRVKVEFIQIGDNLGYSGGNNIGIKKALELDSDYVFVLNPDTRVDKSCISELVKGLESDRENGVAGPKVLFADKKTIWYAGGIFDTNNVLGKHRGVDEKDIGQYEKNEVTDFVSGGAMFIKKNVFDKVGFFDEKYFLYYEDSDFCFRAKKAGFNIMYIPRAVVIHDNAKSTGLGSSLQDYFITRNRLLFAKKHLTFRAQFALFREALKNISSSTRRLAFFDYLSGKFGKGSFIK